MRLGRQNHKSRWIRWLGVLGKPLFWGLYMVVAGVVSLPTRLAEVKQWWRFHWLVGQKVLTTVLSSSPRLHSQRTKRVTTRPSQILWWGLGLVSIAGVAAACWFFVLDGLPQPQDLLRRNQPVTTKIYDRNGQLLYKVYKNQNRSIVTLKDMPVYLIQATLAIEDDQFYQHPGFSLKGIVRAVTKNATTDTIQGGSTITQQLIKNTLLTKEKTLSRKLKEVVLSVKVESYFTKDEILTMYLNEVGYGGTAYGIEEAAQQYFGKSVRQVTLAEAALLAGLPQSPTIYSPFGAQPELAIVRQHAVLKRMVELHMISSEAAEAAKAEVLPFAKPKTDIVAPHFVMFVKDALVQKYGDTVVDSGGLEVTTTLDGRIQQLAETAVQQELERLKYLHVTNAAALVIKPATGEILAMVGSQNYFDTEHDGQVNVTIRPRQPGSSIKPLTYALALQERLVTPSTLIDDAPVVYRTPGSPPYAPQNYDGRFHGKVTVRQALANSYNVPAVKTLSQVGVTNLVTFAQEMGITTWTDPGRFGLSLTLGGGEVKMVDLAAAYSVFANNGIQVPLTPLIEVKDFSNKLHTAFSCPIDATTHTCTGKQLVDPAVAYAISDILADNQARSAAFGSHSVLVIPNQQVAVKTGTTNDMRDNWTFGYTADYLVATWVGNNDNTPMSKVASGITGASPIWQTIMKGLLLNQPTHVFTPPATMVKVTICPLTQTLTCMECPNPRQEYFIDGTQPKRACDTALIEQALASPTPGSVPRDQLLEGVTVSH